jgi:radical SAM enzyme (TIGR01210 family)
VTTDHERLRQQVLRATERGAKDYSCADDRDHGEPLDLFFQESEEGLILFVVLYTMTCRYSQCTFCPLPGTATLRHVSYDQLMHQIDRVFERPDVVQRRVSIRKLILSNQGSVLDEATFSSLALIYFIARAVRSLPDLQTLCIESRAEYIDDDELEFLARAMQEGQGTALELGIGFEAFDDHLRNEVLRKGLILDPDNPRGFENLVRRFARREFRLKCYFMLKPDASLTDEAAIEDIHRAIDYLAELSRRYGAQLSMHLNPTFAGVGTSLARVFAQGRFEPPTLVDLARAALHGEGKGLPIFLGLSDEGLAVPGGSFRRPGDEAAIARLELFNRTGDYDLLREVSG